MFCLFLICLSNSLNAELLHSSLRAERHRASRRWQAWQGAERAVGSEPVTWIRKHRQESPKSSREAPAQNPVLVQPGTSRSVCWLCSLFQALSVMGKSHGTAMVNVTADPGYPITAGPSVTPESLSPLSAFSNCFHFS